MSCEIVKGLLSEYIDCRTNEETKHMIEKHMETCPGCRGIYDDMLEERHLIGIMAGMGPSAGFTDRVMSAIKESLSPYVLLPVPVLGFLILALMLSAMGQAAYKLLNISLTIISGVVTSYIKVMGSSMSVQMEMISVLAVVMAVLILLFGRMMKGAGR